MAASDHPTWIDSLILDAQGFSLTTNLTIEAQEFVGDSLLSFIVTERLFSMFSASSSSSEGDLAAYKSGLLATPVISVFYRDLRLSERGFCPQVDDKKLRAMAVKRLLVLIYKEKGLEHCARLLGYLFFQKDPGLQQLWSTRKPEAVSPIEDPDQVQVGAQRPHPLLGAGGSLPQREPRHQLTAPPPN